MCVIKCYDCRHELCDCCQHLGFAGAIPIGNTDADKPNKPVLLGNVTCNGDEETIGECSAIVYSLQEGKDLLATVDVAGITCLIPSDCDVPPTGGTECQVGATRLTGDDGKSKGNLEYCYNGFWSPTCTLSAIDASIACKEFGYTNYSCECDNNNVYMYVVSMFGLL